RWKRRRRRPGPRGAQAAGRRTDNASAAPVPEFLQPAGGPAAVEDGPEAQAGNAGKDADIGGGDESGVLSQFDHAPVSRAALRSSVITRRRRTSVRMVTTCRVMNRKGKAKNMIKSGMSREGGMVGPSARKTLAGWCRVDHQSTENLMMGTLTAPTRVKTAMTRAARSWSSKARQSAMMPR